MASLWGDAASLALFARAGGKASRSSPEGSKAIVLAIRGGHPDAVRVLLKAGVSAIEPSGERPPLCWAAHGETVEVVQLLLKNGADARSRCEHGIPVLGVAARNGNEGLVAALLDRGAPIGDATPTGSRPLLLAAAAGHPSVCRLLLERGADVGARGAGRATALMRASEAGHVDVVALLLENGANPARRNEQGRSARQLAIASGHPEVGTLLENSRRQKKGFFGLF